MNTTIVVVVLVVVGIVAFAFGRRSRPVSVESRSVAVPEVAVRQANELVPVLPDEHEHLLAVGWLVEGYCLKDKKKVEMINPQPITMKNGTPATVGVCPNCGTKIYKIGKSTPLAAAVARVPEDHERIRQGRREMA